jgi:hypothetical protein
MKMLSLSKPKITVLFALLITLFTAQVTLPVAAAPSNCPTDNSSQSVVLQSINNETGNNCDSSGVTSTISTAVSILSYVVGAASIIMVIAAGFRYVTSGGDSGRVSSAKNTLIYALVGLAIAALAQFLVHYVLSNADNSVQPCPSNSAIAASDPKCK